MALASPTESRIKMVALRKHGIKNITWWSPIKQNRKPAEVICRGMSERFKRWDKAKMTNTLMFYENEKLIASERL